MSDDLADLLGLPKTSAAGAKNFADLRRIRKAMPKTSPNDAAPIRTEYTASDLGYERGETVDDDDYEALKILNGGWPDEGAFLRPVGITFLGTVFGMEPRRVFKKLKNCPIAGRGKVGKGAGKPLYDFKVACAYMVEPRIDLKTWFSSLSTTTMPPIINKAFWDAMRTKSKAMEEMGDYWHTGDVLRVFGEVMTQIRDASMLWVENLPGKAKLTTEDYHALRAQVLALLESIKQELVVKPGAGRTPSIVAEIERDIEAGLLDRHGGGAE